MGFDGNGSDEYFDPRRTPQTLPDNLGDPNMELPPGEMRKQAFQGQFSQAATTLAQAKSLVDQGILQDPAKQTDDVVYLENMREGSIHQSDTGLLLLGQATLDPKGPFLVLTRQQWEQNFHLQLMLEKPLDPGDPTNTGTWLRRLTKEEYQQRYRRFNEIREKRDAKMKQDMMPKYATDEDRQQEDFKVNRKVLHVKMPDIGGSPSI
jgi:hypothetical protein